MLNEREYSEIYKPKGLEVEYTAQRESDLDRREGVYMYYKVRDVIKNTCR